MHNGLGQSPPPAVKSYSISYGSSGPPSLSSVTVTASPSLSGVLAHGPQSFKRVPSSAGLVQQLLVQQPGQPQHLRGK